MKKFILIVLHLLFITFVFAQVDTAWVRRYNGAGNSFDEAYAIAVDNQGNVYVTGASYGSGTQYDYATIKYNSTGETLWVRRYNIPGIGWDIAQDIAVDNQDNIYVTGYSWGSTEYRYDY
ncbi:MAG: SBBP repeat-containing protein, partial [candidate division WOR-3 bacterium]|nr:SBBP repeat-containing protein [candidate division WOR-3 bacterium]